MSARKKMPKIRPPVKMEAALHLMLNVDDHYEHPGEYDARWSFYFDAHRYTGYRSRWMLKTKAGAIARAKREAVQYLQDLRRQIDDVLARIEGADMDEHGLISVPSSAYMEYDAQQSPDDAPGV